MYRQEPRSPTLLENGEAYVLTEDGRLRIGAIDDVVRLVGGPAWTITYTARQRERYPDLDTSDEGLTVDVVDVVNGMDLDGGFVDALRSLPDEPVTDGDVSPRIGLFVGRLLSDLETGLT